MNNELLTQKEYWDSVIDDFDSIYSHKKSKFANWLDQTFRWDMYGRYEYTFKHSTPIEGRRFLDVGCGTGRYALQYAQRGAAHVVGLDVAPKMIEVCNTRAVEQGVQARCTFLVTDLLQYTPTEKFDVAIGIGLFDYISDPLPVLTKMREVVQDRVIGSFPLLYTWRAPVRKARLAMKGCPVYFYSRARLDTLLKQAGFARYELERVGQLYCVTAFVK